MKTQHLLKNFTARSPVSLLCLSVLGTLVAIHVSAQIPGCVAPPVGLVAWWPGDGDSTDRVGMHHGTATGGVSFVPGKVGKAFSFNGTDAFIELLGTFGDTTECSIQAWVRPNRDTGTFEAIVSSTNISFLHFQLANFGVIAVYFEGDGNNFGDLGIPPVSPSPIGVWRHLVLSIRSGDSRVYIDGQMARQITTTFHRLTPTVGLRIGSGYLGQRFFSGEIDEVALWNRALSADDVATLYAAGSAGMCKSPENLGVSIQVSCMDICWNSRSNQTYQVQYQSALTTNQWLNLGPTVPGNDGTNCVTDSVRGVEQRFYRVVELR